MAEHSRREFVRGTAGVSASLLLGASQLWAGEGQPDPRVAQVVAKTIGIDTHNHIDVPMTEDELPGPDLDLHGEMERSGLAALCMTFATDYQRGDAYDRFLKAMASMDRQLQLNKMKRALTPEDVMQAHQTKQPTVVQSIEGAHFLQGRLERVQEAYNRGLRHFGLLHDSDASTPLGDVYTNPPQFGGLTPFGASVIKECNRLGILVDLAHASLPTTQAALKVSTKPVLISHTGLATRLGNNPRMAEMMKPRLISPEQAKLVAASGGAVGVWTHLADTSLEYAQNIRAMVDVIGVDHVCIGTDTKLTQPNARFFGPPAGGFSKPGEGGPKPHTEGQALDSQQSAKRQSGPPLQRVGERTNNAWTNQTAGFYFVVVDALLKTGFRPEEIAKIGGENYLRILGK